MICLERNFSMYLDRLIHSNVSELQVKTSLKHCPGITQSRYKIAEERQQCVRRSGYVLQTSALARTPLPGSGAASSSNRPSNSQDPGSPHLNPSFRAPDLQCTMPQCLDAHGCLLPLQTSNLECGEACSLGKTSMAFEMLA